MAYDDENNRDLVFKLDEYAQYDQQETQEYAQVLRMCGKARCEVKCCEDGWDERFICHRRLGNWDDKSRFRPNKLEKQDLIAPGDIVLIRRYRKRRSNVDIIVKYTPKEARLLKAIGELPSNIRLNDDIYTTKI